MHGRERYLKSDGQTRTDKGYYNIASDLDMYSYLLNNYANDAFRQECKYCLLKMDKSVQKCVIAVEV